MILHGQPLHKRGSVWSNFCNIMHDALSPEILVNMDVQIFFGCVVQPQYARMNLNHVHTWNTVHS